MSTSPPPERVADVFARPLAERPDHEALVTRRGRWTYRQLDDLADRAATALAGLGVRPGDRVAASLPNELDVVTAFHGAMRLGAVWVGVNRPLAPPEKRFLLEDSGASLLLCEPATAEQVAGQPGVQVVVDGDWSALVAAAPPGVERPPVDPMAPAGLAYTSGTTGRPKGAVHGQRALLLPGAVLVADRGWGPDLRKGDCLPLTILNMLVLTTLLVAQAGGTCVLMDRIDADGVAEWIEAERVTVWNGPPALLHSLAASPTIERSALASLREVLSGGGELPEALRQRFEERFGHPIINSYGLSEAPTVVALDPAGQHVEGASGRVLPSLQVQALAEDGTPVAPGEVGELCVRAAPDGPWAGRWPLLQGYWGRPEASAEVTRGGVLHTGDLGLVDEGGWLFVKDRKNLVIIRGGANVYPAEVERVLLAVPGIAGCAVVGLPDERLGERVVAALELDPGATVDLDALTATCLDQLARYKVPERFEVVERLPRNSMGKVDRRSLAPLFA